MLELAHPNASELQRMLLNSLGNPKYKFYSLGDYSEYVHKIEESNWSKIQYVSIGDGRSILGYMEACVQRYPFIVTNLGFISFTDNPSTRMRVAVDFYKFMAKLFAYYKFDKIKWSVACGSPIEKVYDKLTIKYGGRIVGIFKNDIALADRTVCDHKYYEILREDFEKRIVGNKRVERLITNAYGLGEENE